MNRRNDNSGIINDDHRTQCRSSRATMIIAGGSRTAPTSLDDNVRHRMILVTGIVMGYDPNKHHRRSIRLRGYDYTAQGAYFVTICVRGRKCVLGEIFDGAMRLNDWGQAVAESWQWLEHQYEYITLDTWVVMPNHMHGIIVVGEAASTGAPNETHSKHKSLGRLIGAFKTVSTKHINHMCETPGAVFWQRNFWEHIIREDSALNSIREYIRTNPVRWAGDQLHPEARPNQFNQE